MTKRIVRLTEAELIHLVKRVVREQQEIEEGFFSDNFGWIKDAAKEVARLFKSEVLPEIPEEELEDLKDQARGMNVKSVLSNVGDFASSEEGKEALEKADEHISPDVLTEAVITEGLSDRVIRILAKTGVISGIGLTAAGFVSFASQVMGYIDYSFLVQVNEIVQGFGCSMFCGPLSVLVIVLGTLLALGSVIVGYDKRKR